MRKFALMVIVSLTCFVGTVCADPIEYVQVEISGQFPNTFTNYYFSNQGPILGFQTVQEGTDFRSASQRNAPFSFTILFNPEDQLVNVPNVGSRFTDVTLLGGNVGSFAYNDFTAQAYITQTSALRLVFHLQKLIFEHDTLPGRNQYLDTWLTFEFADDQLTSTTQLPQGPWSTSDVTYTHGEFRYQGGDSGGPEWSYWRFSPAFSTSGTMVVPEPAGAALLGLSTLALLRRRRA